MTTVDTFGGALVGTVAAALVVETVALVLPTEDADFDTVATVLPETEVAASDAFPAVVETLDPDCDVFVTSCGRQLLSEEVFLIEESGFVAVLLVLLFLGLHQQYSIKKKTKTSRTEPAQPQLTVFD